MNTWNTEISSCIHKDCDYLVPVNCISDRNQSLFKLYTCNGIWIGLQPVSKKNRCSNNQYLKSKGDFQLQIRFTSILVSNLL